MNVATSAANDPNIQPTVSTMAFFPFGFQKAWFDAYFAAMQGNGCHEAFRRRSSEASDLSEPCDHRVYSVDFQHHRVTEVRAA